MTDFALTPTQVELLAETIEAGWGKGHADHHTSTDYTILEAFTEHLQLLRERSAPAVIAVHP
ncbi:hypothetical protein HZF05_11055 [Sphingomonas sp. CGMCC 1.13654]|uniref:Uncharacterized protein n=1 Tax=Sphingomonas chungangi TaxID=2683589 RepID=A0A838L568_9SPHN|nr:hypothetical protein [Sphingomonas chungangi]MBA2934633.1 hypothetical protein [Sphingomonas chungangi]MVW57668.1 hypothetical protein [Sphingomonas chungangi]